jgi:type VI protein secretion system component Hcp
MTGNRAAAGATLEAIMSKQNSIIQPVADGRSRPIELSQQQLDNVAGGTKSTDLASPNLFAQCCTGKHIPHGNVTAS